MTFSDILRRLFGHPDAALARLGRSREHHGLHWRTDLIDLLRVLDLDASVEGRRELANDLGVPFEDNAASNKRLHAVLMDRLRAFGDVS